MSHIPKNRNRIRRREDRYVEVTLSPVEAGYVRLLSAVLQESEEEVVADLLLGRLKPAGR